MAGLLALVDYYCPALFVIALEVRSCTWEGRSPKGGKVARRILERCLGLLVHLFDDRHAKVEYVRTIAAQKVLLVTQPIYPRRISFTIYSRDFTVVRGRHEHIFAWLIVFLILFFRLLVSCLLLANFQFIKRNRFYEAATFKSVFVHHLASFHLKLSFAAVNQKSFALLTSKINLG